MTIHRTRGPRHRILRSLISPNLRAEEPTLNVLERLSNYTVRGTRAVLKNPLLLVGLMLLSLVIKLLSEPDDPGR